MPEPKRCFAVLHHVTHDGEHWDLMLERGGALATWQVTEPPSQWNKAGRRVLSRRISDHRLAYLEYEGPVSRDRGHVTRVDSGTYEMLDVRPDGLVVMFEGNILRGRFQMGAPDIGSTGEICRLE